MNSIVTSDEERHLNKELLCFDWRGEGGGGVCTLTVSHEGRGLTWQEAGPETGRTPEKGTIRENTEQPREHEQGRIDNSDWT